MLIVGTCQELAAAQSLNGPHGATSIVCSDADCDQELKDTNPPREKVAEAGDDRLGCLAHALGWRVCVMDPLEPRASSWYAGYFCPFHALLRTVIEVHPGDTDGMERAFWGSRYGELESHSKC